MSYSTGFQNDAAISDDSDVEVSAPGPLRRSLLLFSLLLQEPLPRPEPKDYEHFLHDDRHFSLVRNLHMADFITLLNGFSGFYSIILCMRFALTGRSHYIQRAHFFICLGLFFDFFDGRVARLRQKASLMGQELDSLADLVSFSVSPAIIAFAIGFRSTLDVLILAYWVLCGLTRLARFNVSTNNIPKDALGKLQYFEGLPVPSNLVFVVLMLVLVYTDCILERLPGPVLWENTVVEFHAALIFFVLQGCAEISKSLRIPKP